MPNGRSMHSRRQAREWAVQMLFELDANPGQAKSLAELFATFWNGGLRLKEQGEDQGAVPDESARRFAELLVTEASTRRAEIDETISKRLKNWTLDRVGAAERAVLRVATAELTLPEGPDRAPDPVVINEAVDLAKYFGTNESGRFVNGILDAMARRRRADKAREREMSQVWNP